MSDLAHTNREIFGADDPNRRDRCTPWREAVRDLGDARELRHADDLGDYWRLRMDGRGLNYDRYFSEGDVVDLGETSDYHSHNTERLDVEGTKELLLSLPEIRRDLEEWGPRS